MDPESAALVFDLLPAEWLDAAAVTREEFNECYFRRTGRRRENQGGQQPADKTLGRASVVADQKRRKWGKFERDFKADVKEHLEGSVREAASLPPPIPSRPVELPSEGLYIHLNGESKGPFTVEQLKALLAVETITRDTLCCHEGAEAWQTVSAYVA